MTTTPATASAIVPTLTRAGLAAIRNLQGSGLQGTLSAIAVGSGTGAGMSAVGYTPTGAETALKAEQARVPLLSGTLLGDPTSLTDPLGFRVTAEVPPVPQGGATYPINEVGFILSDGTLLALWSDPAYPLAFSTTLAAVDLALDLFLQQLPPNALTITVQNPDVPDTTGVLAELLAGLARRTTDIMAITDRLTLRGL